jgi:hypothetical protein
MIGTKKGIVKNEVCDGCGFMYKGRFVMGGNKKKVLFETELYFLLEVYNEYQDLTSNYEQSAFIWFDSCYGRNPSAA